MPNQLQRIKELIPNLPKDDIALATKFYEEKDWESLKELTWSALQRCFTGNKKRRQISIKYRDLDIDKLEELALECNDYYYLIYPPEEDVDYVYDEEEEEEVE